MYRQSAESGPGDKPPSELVVAIHGQDRRSGAVLLFQLFTLPAVAGVVLSMALSPTAGLVGLLGTAALTVWWYRRRAQGERLVLSVASGELVARSGRRELARVRLQRLEDVALDVKTIRPVREGSSAIPAMRFIDSKVGPEIDVGRLVLVGEGRTVRLHEEHVAHMTATEWLGKIRVFLRKHGWVPRDESGVPSGPASADEE
ncbi:MAG TPA: hypothetical protein VIF09_10700 [Polyangiaceae bacterium]